MRGLVLGLVFLIVAVITAPQSQADVNEVDRAFVPLAIQGSLSEIQEAQLAERRSGSRDVKIFAQRMIRDHAQANTELKNITNSMTDIDQPAKQSDAQKDDQLRLQELTGEAFDRTYMAMQVQKHERMIERFEHQASWGGDMALRAFATKQLPALREHLEMARTLQAAQ